MSFCKNFHNLDLSSYIHLSKSGIRVAVTARIETWEDQMATQRSQEASALMNELRLHVICEHSYVVNEIFWNMALSLLICYHKLINPKLQLIFDVIHQLSRLFQTTPKIQMLIYMSSMHAFLCFVLIIDIYIFLTRVNCAYIMNEYEGLAGWLQILRTSWKWYLILLIINLSSSHKKKNNNNNLYIICLGRWLIDE